LLLLLLAGSLSFVPAGKATGTDISGLDVIILIDQSGSMFGAGPRSIGNDKYNHRIGQAKNIVYRLAEHVEGTTLVHRVSVIDFGSKAAVVFPSQLRLSFVPGDPGRAIREAKTLAERYLIPKNLGDTNTPEAVALGIQELEKM